MKKIRVYELSKQVGLSNKQLMNYLTDNLGVAVKSHSSTVEDDIAAKVMKAFDRSDTEKTASRSEKPEVSKISTAKEDRPAGEKKETVRIEKQKLHTQPKTGDDESKKAADMKKRRPRKKGQPLPKDGSTATIKEKLQQPNKQQAPVLQTKTFPRPMDRGKRGRRDRKFRNPEVTMKESKQKWMTLPESVTVGDLAQKLGVSASELIKLFMQQGLMITINHSLTFEDAAQLVKKFGFKVEREKIEKPEDEEEIVIEENLVPRPPVVTILGHVDHGKTSLLDVIRNSNVTAQESGGITQRIGAYTVKVQDKDIVFVDTPGHEAFTSMRARGAQVTDIAILVVAADDGIMPQTLEAINHARAAKVPIIVAINKIDKSNANPERVKQQLAERDLLPEDWGGSTVTVLVSAHTKAGINELLEMILLVADMQELKADLNKKATGIVIESKLDKGFGPVATVIVQDGTLQVGDAFVVGNEHGKIRFMITDRGKRVQKSLPSYPVEVTGLSGVPEAGDRLVVIEDDRTAKNLSEERKTEERTGRMQVDSRVTLDDLFRQMEQGEIKDLNLILKAEANGSLEALRHSLIRMSGNEVRINVIHGGVGAISETDIALAQASNAIIIGFNVRPDPMAKRLAEQNNIDIRLYRVIYHIIEDIKLAMSGLLEPEYEEVMLGRAEVRAIYKVSKIGVIAGSYVLEGKILRNARVRILRDNVVIFEDKINTLRRFKEDVNEVQSGFECGIFIDKFPGIQTGDIIEAYKLNEIKREIEIPDPASDEKIYK